MFCFLISFLTPVAAGAFCIPVYIPYILTGRWTLGRGLCKLWLVMDYLLCSASVFNIVLISYDRFLSVTRAVSGTSRALKSKRDCGTQNRGNQKCRFSLMKQEYVSVDHFRVFQFFTTLLECDVKSSPVAT